MSLVRHSSRRGLKRTWTPNPSLAVMPGTPARTTRSGLNFRSIGGAAYGPKGYLAGAALDYAANKIKRAYTNYRNKSGKMFASHIPRSMKLMRFRTPRFDVGSKGKSSSRRMSTRRQSVGSRVTRIDLQTIKNVIMPSLKAIEYVTSGKEEWNAGRQDVMTFPGYTSQVMDRLFFKGRDLMSTAFNAASVPTGGTNDYHDRLQRIQLVHARMNVQLVNMCNHDLTVTKYVYVCRKACTLTPEDMWNADMNLGLTIQTDVIAPTSQGSTTSYGNTPKNNGLIMLNKYWKLVEEKKIKLEVGSQYKDVTRQKAGFYKGTQWRNPVDMLAVETYLTSNANTLYWPGMVMPMYISKASDFVVATSGSVTTPGSGKVMWNLELDYIIRVPPVSLAVAFARTDMPTGLVDEIHFNPETEASNAYAKAGV